MTSFDAQSNRRIIRSVLQSESMVGPGVSRARHKRPVRGSGRYGGYAVATSRITAYNETTKQAGKGTAKRYKLGEGDIVATTGDDFDVYHMAAEISSGTDIQYKIDEDGTRWVDVERCD